jgi:EpsI family protein
MASLAVAGGFVRPPQPADGTAPINLDSLFPSRFGRWRLDTAAAAFVRAPDPLTQALYQQLLERTYIDAQGWRVMLSAAYGREQAGGLEMHWPEVCYRYGGFGVRGRHLADLGTPDAPAPVTRLIAELPGRPEPVTYWAVLGGVRAPDGNTFRLRRLNHAVRREVADGLLVRLSSIDYDAERAFAIQAEFVKELLAAVSPADRARITGIASAA